MSVTSKILSKHLANLSNNTWNLRRDTERYKQELSPKIPIANVIKIIRDSTTSSSIENCLDSKTISVPNLDISINSIPLELVVFKSAYKALLHQIASSIPTSVSKENFQCDFLITTIPDYLNDLSSSLLETLIKNNKETIQSLTQNPNSIKESDFELLQQILVLFSYISNPTPEQTVFINQVLTLFPKSFSIFISESLIPKSNPSFVKQASQAIKLYEKRLYGQLAPYVNTFNATETVNDDILDLESREGLEIATQALQQELLAITEGTRSFPSTPENISNLELDNFTNSYHYKKRSLDRVKSQLVDLSNLICDFHRTKNYTNRFTIFLKISFLLKKLHDVSIISLSHKLKMEKLITSIYIGNILTTTAVETMKEHLETTDTKEKQSIEDLEQVIIKKLEQQEERCNQLLQTLYTTPEELETELEDFSGETFAMEFKKIQDQLNLYLKSLTSQNTSWESDETNTELLENLMKLCDDLESLTSSYSRDPKSQKTLNDLPQETLKGYKLADAAQKIIEILKTIPFKETSNGRCLITLSPQESFDHLKIQNLTSEWKSLLRAINAVANTIEEPE